MRATMLSAPLRGIWNDVAVKMGDQSKSGAVAARNRYLRLEPNTTKAVTEVLKERLSIYRENYDVLSELIALSQQPCALAQINTSIEESV